MSVLAAFMSQQGNVLRDGTPLDYGSILRQFLDAEFNVTEASGTSVQWDDRLTGDEFVIPSGGSSGKYQVPSQNGLPGVEFDEPADGRLNRKLVNDANAVDNHFASSGNASISFAGRLNRMTDSQFGLSSTLCSKGFVDSGGWTWFVEPNGSMEFRHRRSNGSFWRIRASGFYKAQDLVMGSITYDGGNSSNSGRFRLYNNNIGEFVTTGTVTVGTASSIGSDSSSKLTIGNVFDPHSPNLHAPYQGPIFGIWFTRPSATFIDESFMQRWIPD